MAHNSRLSNETKSSSQKNIYFTKNSIRVTETGISCFLGRSLIVTKCALKLSLVPSWVTFYSHLEETSNNFLQNTKLKKYKNLQRVKFTVQKKCEIVGGWDNRTLSIFVLRVHIRCIRILRFLQHIIWNIMIFYY